MSSIDQQFVEYIVKSLVSKPDAVKVDRRIDEKGVLLELTVDPEDLGRVIGKRGGTAQSLRILLRALGTKNDARYNLKIIDNGYPRPQRDDSYHSAPAAAGPIDEPTKDTPKDEPAQDETSEPVVEEPAVKEAEEEVAAAEPESSDEERGSVVSKTRKELEDLDDLDI